MGFWSKFGAIAPFAAFAIPGVGPAVGGGLRAAFAGGLGSKILRGIGTAADPLGRWATSRATGRAIEGTQQLGQDELQARLYDTVTRNLMERYGLESRNQLGLFDTNSRNQLGIYDTNSRNVFSRAALGAELAKFQLGAPSARFDQAIRGALAANMQDVVANVPGRYAGSKVTFAGGLRPSALGPEGRAAGQQLAQLALSRMGKDTFEIPDVPTPPTITPPTLSAPPNLPAPPTFQGMPQSNWLDKFLSVMGPASAFVGGLTNDDFRKPIPNPPPGQSWWGGQMDPSAGFGQPPPPPIQGIDPDVLFKNLRGQL